MTPFLTLAILCFSAGADTTLVTEVDALPPMDKLPDPMLMNDGRRVTTPEEWPSRRREIIEMLLYWEYGHMPPAPDNLHTGDVVETEVLDGAAVEHRATLIMGPEDRVRVRMGLYTPKAAGKPMPVLLAIEPVWEEHLRPVAQRALERGYLFAGFQRHDLDADSADRSDGVHPIYPDYDWASLAVWAWGCMRVIDYLATLPAVDPERIILTGHSRAGKVALLAGALDERVAIAAPHASGAGGAGSYRIPAKGCETLAFITLPQRFDYWFHPRLRLFAGKVDRLPFDQHFLRALVAPRAVLSIDGLEDHWANPPGTQAMYLAAQPVFDFLAAAGKNAAFFRPGGHDTTEQDWEVLLDFADHVFDGKPLPAGVNELPFERP